MESAQTSGEPPTAYTFAHLSDPHLTEPDAAHWSEMLNKRAFGYLSWRRRQASKASSAVLDRLREDVLEGDPDHIAVTGDLTNLGTPVEYNEAARWLASLGDPEGVSVIPGNHDCYARDARVVPARLWQPWVGPSEGDLPGFPYVRYRGPVAFIGVSSACPTPVGMATGSVGNRQRRTLAALLERTGAAGYFRVLLIHHPPHQGAVSRRKCLTDAEDFRQTIRESGTELVLHGHAHRFGYSIIPAGDSWAPVLGVPAAAAPVAAEPHCAGYYRLTLNASEDRWYIDVKARGLDCSGFRFGALPNASVTLGPWAPTTSRRVAKSA